MIHVTIKTPRGPVGGVVSEETYRQMWQRTVKPSMRPKPDGRAKMTKVRRDIVRMVKRTPTHVPDLAQRLGLPVPVVRAHCGYLVQRRVIAGAGKTGWKRKRVYYVEGYNEPKGPPDLRR